MRRSGRCYRIWVVGESCSPNGLSVGRRATISANVIVTILRAHLDTNDRLLVVSLDRPDWANFNTMVDPNDI